ncbi:two-component regulator propeller domain-containing protein [Rhodocytophaga aerolata]|uniref:Two-component regulator propeller domain-containing protein n=1 Tax=Rhodocytophaga aerolata TaxID=455078 RepID=A0ABT8RH93_9BACT|nr:two-component regulator propeller domain-containing protein [Rhodocytophaga aerolata]MDO1451476.1 two-component regulator propeller domain-containing protein [Rhodocytophaga aerolata]
MRKLYISQTALWLCCFITLFSCKNDDIDYSLNDKPRWQLVPGQTGLRRNEVLDLMVDASGNIWAGYGLGIGKYDGQSWKFYRPFDYDVESPIGNNYTHGLGQDKAGNIWASIHNNHMTSACRFDGTNWTKYEVYSAMLPSINQLDNGQIWFGAGSCVYDNGTFSKEFNTPAAYSSIKDTKGLLWFGGYDGQITTYDGTSFSTTTIPKVPYSYQYTCDILNLSLSPRGEIYAALGAGGAWKYNGITWIPVYVPEITPSSTSVPSISCVIEDSKGTIWVGTSHDHLYEINNGKITRHILGDGRGYLITSIVEGKNGKLYLGAIGGVFDYDYNRK